MPYSLEDRLVIAISSRALFQLESENSLFDRDGDEAAYMRHQQENEGNPLNPGTSFPFIKRLLSLNDLREADNPIVEVVLLSRNDVNSGIRIQNSIKHHGLNISRMIFTRGKEPFPYLAALKSVLFLSKHKADVDRAIQQQLPAGLIIEGAQSTEEDSREVRIAFDFDGVLASDEAEKVYRNSSLAEFHASEHHRRCEPLPPGPLKPLLDAIALIQAIESQRQTVDTAYSARLRVAIVTARNAPAHERLIRTLRSWNIQVHEAMFLGGLEKAPFLAVLKPHIFFDDQGIHAKPASEFVPSVHIPYGIRNEQSTA